MTNAPAEFTRDNFCLKHTPSGVQIWITNGFWFYGLYEPYRQGFSFIDCWRFGRAFRKWQRIAIELELNKIVED